MTPQRVHQSNAHKRKELLTMAYTRAIITQRELARKYQQIQRMTGDGFEPVVIERHQRDARLMHQEMSNWLGKVL